MYEGFREGRRASDGLLLLGDGRLGDHLKRLTRAPGFPAINQVRILTVVISGSSLTNPVNLHWCCAVQLPFRGRCCKNKVTIAWFHGI